MIHTFNLVFLGCGNGNSLNPETSDSLRPMAVAKWYNNHAAAISVTYVSGSPESAGDKEVQQIVLSRNMILDYGLVTEYISQKKLEYIPNMMIPLGFQFFGHGHEHINHDALSYKEALQSFTLN